MGYWSKLSSIQHEWSVCTDWLMFCFSRLLLQDQHEKAMPKELEDTSLPY